MSRIDEKTLRSLLRNIILEIEKDDVDDEEEKDVLGEPDLSAEDERDNPSYGVDEINALGAVGGTVTGHQGPGKSSAHEDYDPENPRYKKNKKRKK